MKWPNSLLLRFPPPKQNFPAKNTQQNFSSLPSTANKDRSTVNYCKSSTFGCPYVLCNDHCDRWIIPQSPIPYNAIWIILHAVSKVNVIKKKKKKKKKKKRKGKEQNVM